MIRAISTSAPASQRTLRRCARSSCGRAVYRGPGFPPPAAAWRLEDFDAATADEQLWVAECDGQPVGFAAVWTADNFLHHLFVDPDWQGKHIGSALLAQVERTFTASGTLKCLMENKNALRFYQRHGWTIEAQGASPKGRYWLMRSPRP